jgi:hypothetical protein
VPEQFEFDVAVPVIAGVGANNMLPHISFTTGKLGATASLKH